MVVQLVTLVTITHLCTLFIIVDSYIDLSIYEEIIYYYSLFIICYSTELCSVFWNSHRYNAVWLHMINYILLPIFALPVSLITVYAVANSILQTMTTIRFIGGVIYSVLHYKKHRDHSFIVPLLISYLPLLIISKHICVLIISVVLAKSWRYNTQSR